MANDSRNLHQEYLKQKASTKKSGTRGPKQGAANAGRPTRTDRPEHYATRFTNPGEERYKVTLKTERIATMKDIAAAMGVNIKDVYELALSEFIQRHPLK